MLKHAKDCVAKRESGQRSARGVCATLRQEPPRYAVGFQGSEVDTISPIRKYNGRRLEYCSGYFNTMWLGIQWDT